MNIFILNEDPEIAAREQCDKHVVKMILESAQLMAAACLLNGAESPYKLTHQNHPCSIWARTTRDNYDWLLIHHIAMLDEYTHRYGKMHKTADYLDFWEQGSKMIPAGELTPFAQAMPEELRVPGDAVSAYRAFYNRDKAPFATWKNRNVPDWFDGGLLLDKELVL